MRAEPTIEFEVNSFMRWLAELNLVPAIEDIRFNVEQLRANESNAIYRGSPFLHPANVSGLIC